MAGSYCISLTFRTVSGTQQVPYMLMEGGKDERRKENGGERGEESTKMSHTILFTWWSNPLVTLKVLFSGF